MNRRLTSPDPIIREESETQTNKQIAEFYQWFSDLFGGGVLYIKVFFGERHVE